MPGPSWNQWKNRRLQITTRSSAFPLVSEHFFDYTAAFPSSWLHCLIHNDRSSLLRFGPDRPEDHDRETEEQILCDQEAFHCRPAANHHQLSRVQPFRQRVLQVCQHLGEVLLLQIKRWRPDREMNSTTELFTDFLTDEEQLSQLPHTEMEPITRKTLLAIVISE